MQTLCLCSSCPTLCDPLDYSPQTSLSMGFFRQEYWSRLPFPSPGNLPDPGIEPESPALQADSLPFSHQGNPVIYIYTHTYVHAHIQKYTHSHIWTYLILTLTLENLSLLLRRRNCSTERLRKLPQVTEPESSKRNWDLNQAGCCWSPALTTIPPCLSVLPKASHVLLILFKCCLGTY